MIIALTVLYALVWFFRDALLSRAIDLTLKIARTQLVDRGVEIDTFDYESAQVAGLWRIEIRGIKAHVRTDGRILDRRPLAMTARADVLQFELTNPLAGHGIMRVTNASGRFSDGRLPEQLPFDRIEDVIWEHPIDFSLRAPGAAIADVRQSFVDIVETNCTRADMRFSGTLVVVTGTETAYIPVESVTRGECTTLMIDPGRVRGLLRAGDIDFTEAEVRIVAEHPLRAPETIRLAGIARRAASELDRSILGFPKDAYRHVYWSYLLTQRFGAEYAQAVTDAHETIEFNTREEAAMDIINNTIGRRYALEGIDENELLKRVLTAPDIVRSPSEMIGR